MFCPTANDYPNSKVKILKEERERERYMNKSMLISFSLLSPAGGMWYGVDITHEDIADNYEACVWEPAIVRINALTAATEAACLILSIDETVKNPKANRDDPSALPGQGKRRF